MNLLASILPGVRELRAPLAAGYLWLLNFWLWFGDALHDQGPTPGIVSKLQALEGVISTFGLAIVISFAAYLVGAVSESVSSTVLKLIGRSRALRLPWVYRFLGHYFYGPISAQDKYADVLIEDGLDLVRQAKPSHSVVRRKWGEINIQDPSEEEVFRYHVFRVYESRAFEQSDQNGENAVATESAVEWGFIPRRESYAGEEAIRDSCVAAASNDMNLVRSRLMAEQTTLYGEYDRIESEAEFRAALVPPLLVLVIAVTIIQFLQWGMESLLWLLILIPIAGLFLDALTRVRRADVVLLQAVSSGNVSSPLLESFERVLPMKDKTQGKPARSVPAEASSSKAVEPRAGTVDETVAT
jgi:hypothetical protein